MEQSVIGAGVSVQGELSGAENVLLQGNMKGTIELAQNRLTVSESAVVDAVVTAKHIVIAGSFTGDIQAAESVELRATARFSGSILCDRIAIEAGATIVGKIEVVRERESTKEVAKAAAAGAGAASSGAQPQVAGSIS